MRVDASKGKYYAVGVGDPDVRDSTTWAARPMAEWRERGYVPDSDDEDDINLGIEPSTTNPLKAPAAPATSQKSGPVVIPDGERICSEDLERTTGTIFATIEKDPLLQEAQHILSKGSTSGDNEELLQSYSSAKSPTGTGEWKRISPATSQPNVSESIEVNDAVLAASVGDQLQAELEYGLRSVKQILGDASMQLRSNSVNRSLASSPLSSSRSLTDDDESVAEVANAMPLHVQANRALTAERMDLDYQNDAPHYVGRDLRRRRPIQLHPYALEDARYQQELKAHGLKPMRITTGSSGICRKLASNDTQDQDLYSSSPMDDYAEARSIKDSHITPHSQHISSPGLSREARYSSPPGFLNDDDDELPELSAILKGDIRGLYGRKRRKFEHKSSKEASQPLRRNDFHVPELPLVDLDSDRCEDMEIDMLEIPPSPPRSSSSGVSKTSMIPSERRQLHQCTTPQGLSTPVEESEYSSDSSEDSQLGHSTIGFYSLHGDTGHSKGIQSMQRKIKGVLPASWLTLDLGKQPSRNRLRKSSVDSPLIQLGAKGVAQRLKTSRPRNSVAVDEDVSVIDISDNSSEDTDPSSSKEKGTRWTSSLSVENDDFSVPSLDDLVENNRIGRGAQLPPKQRRTLDESFGLIGASQSVHSEMLQARHRCRKRSKATGHSEARPKHRPSKSVVPSLQPGILDAPAFTQLRVQDQPQFLRIVARRALTQKDKRLVRKSQKSIQLTSEGGRHDVNSVLLHQPENQIKHQENKTPMAAQIITQQHVREYQLNPQSSDLPNPSTKITTIAIDNPDETVTLKNSTATTIRQILLRQVGTLAPTTLDNVSIAPTVSKARLVHSRHSLPRILLSHFQNRSGKGRLTSTLTQVREPRSAQLEATQSPGYLGNRPGALHSHLVAFDHPATTAAVTAHDFNPPLSRRVAGAEAISQNNAVQGPSSRKRMPQHLDSIARVHQQPIDPPTLATQASTTRRVANQQESSKSGGDRTDAILRKGEMTSLVLGTFYHESTFIGSGELVKTVLKITEVPRNFDLDTGRICSFSFPQAYSHYNWSAWNQTVASQLRSVCETLLRECSAAMTTGQNTGHATLTNLMLHMRTIIGYINNVLYFEEATARISYVTTCVEIVLSMVVTIQSDERRLPDELEGDALHMLNHLVVFAYQVSHIAEAQTIEPDLQIRAWNLFDTIARHVLSLTLGSRGQLKLIEYLEVNKIRSARESGIRMDYPEVDALVIVPHLCRGKTLGESCSTMISKILTTKVEEHDTSLTRDRLAEVMLFAWTVTPYFFIDASGCLSKRKPSATDFSSWPVIVPVFEAFLKSRALSEDPNSSDNVIGRRYVNFCLRLATAWGWIDCAGLVQLLRIYYGTNNMDELFAERSRGTRDFLENYAEYGRIALPVDNDSGFDSFLKLIIVSGLQKASRGDKNSHLSNFIFSLVPNSGQVLRKDQDHDLQVLRPLQNRHDLYSALYFVSPLETKIRLLPQIQSLVNIKESHISACIISLKTLVRLVRFQISTDEDLCVLHDLGKLIQEMIKKTEEQFDAARVEALAQVQRRLSRSDALKIMRFNQDKIQRFLTHIIRAWSECIQSCRTPDQARELLFSEDLEAVLSLCVRTTTLGSVEISNIGAFRNDVIEVILSTITSYIDNWLPKAESLRDPVDKLHLPLKRVLSTQLGRHQQCSDEILRSLTYCWHALAKVSVDRGLRSWDNYLSLGGRDAWESFNDTWHKRQYEVYFAALFLESNKDMWDGWQVPMLHLWIASLLVPEARFKYQAELTTQIMCLDSSCNPLLFHLPLVLYEDKLLVKVHLEELIAARTALVLALLRNMNKSTTRPDSQDCFFGPSEDEYCLILKMMMALMRQYLEELELEPAEQEIYANFVSRVLSEMRIYTTHLVPVPEEFEYVPGKFVSVAPGTIKAKLGLYKQLLVESGMEKHMIVFLHTTAERAAITGQQDAFENQLVSVFLDLTAESLEDAQGYAADAQFRTLFFQNVFPAYLDRIFYGSGFIVARPVLGCILSVYKGLRFRFGFWTREFLEQFLLATLSILSTLKTTLAGSIASPERILTDPSQLSAYAFLCSIMSEIICRCQEMEDYFGSFRTLSDIWEYFLFFYKYTLMVAFRPPQALPEKLLDDDDQTELLEPKLSATDDTMLAYARRELGDILDFKWVPGLGGTWFVKRAGGRKEQVQGGAVGSREHEMYRMQAAAKRYVDVFAALWNAE